MALRADAIRLARTSPLGAATLDALADFDTIVITGSNGAGKSTLLEPLHKSGRAGEVSCIDTATNAVTIYNSQGVQQTVTFLTSTELMTEFRDLTQALALASNATRLQDESRVITQVLNELRKSVGPPVGTEPPRLEALRQNYLHSDAACGSRPRTVQEYERLGKGLAARKGIAWQTPSLEGDADARVQAERRLLPDARTLVGLSEIRPCLASLKTVPLPGPTQPSAAQQAAQAAEALQAAFDLACAQIPGVSVPSDGPLVRRAESVLASLRDAREALNRAIAAKDLLRACRRNALDYIGGQMSTGAVVSSCPVCETPVDASALSGSLQRQADGADGETESWNRQVKQIDTVGKQLKACIEESERTSKLAAAEHQRIHPVVTAGVGVLRPAAGWAVSVSGVAEDLRGRCEAWLRSHGGAPSAEGVDAVREIVALAAQCLERLETEQSALNGDLPEAQTEFRALQALGAALAVRMELDRLDWNASLDQLDAEKRRTAQRDLWLKVLRAMAEARDADALTATSAVVDDPGVQSRFQRLIARVQPMQPALAGLDFRGDSVQVQGEDRGETLSEGQRVIVNIAAALAVVGKVAGTDAHRPGWIVFDEPSNGLDESSRDAVAAHLGGLSTAEVPSQIFVATFDEAFANRIIDAAKGAGRRVKHVALPDHRPGRAFDPTIRTS